MPRLSKLGKGSLAVGGISRESRGACEEAGAKYIHCVEEPCGREQSSGDNTGGGAGGLGLGGVVVEWARRPGAAAGGGAAGGYDVQEVLVKCRVGQFPSQKSFYLLVSGLSLSLSLDLLHFASGT